MRHHFAFLSAFVFAICSFQNVMAQPPTWVSQKPAPRVGTPEKLIIDDVKAFVTALNGEHPLLNAEKYVWKARIGFYGASEWQRSWLRKPRKDYLVVTDVRINKITAADAEITVTYRRNDEELEPQNEGPFALKFGFSPLDFEKQQNKVWQFVPREPSKDEDLTSLRWAIWALEQSPTALPSFRAKAAQYNLKSIAEGVFQLAQDFNEVFALSSEFQEEAINPYLPNSSLWTVPGTKEKILFNERLSGKNIAQIAEPARTILFYDGADEKPIYRYEGKTAVALADGHVELANAERFKTFLWQ